jgi:hypothetical protein
MGSAGLSRSLPGTLSVEQVRKTYAQWCAEDERKFGTDPYSGSWATIDTLSFDPSSTHANQDVAQQYCYDRTSKRQALAVKYQHITRSLVRPVTFNGKPPSGWADWTPTTLATPVLTRAQDRTFVACDQLSAREQTAITTKALAMDTARTAARTASGELERELTALKTPEGVFLPKRLKALRTAAFRLQERARIATEQFMALHTQLAAKVYTYTETAETRWLVCGWASS